MNGFHKVHVHVQYVYITCKPDRSPDRRSISPKSSPMPPEKYSTSIN